MDSRIGGIGLIDPGDDDTIGRRSDPQQIAGADIDILGERERFTEQGPIVANALRLNVLSSRAPHRRPNQNAPGSFSSIGHSRETNFGDGRGV